jgi:hypothetical protein
VRSKTVTPTGGSRRLSKQAGGNKKQNNRVQVFEVWIMSRKMGKDDCVAEDWRRSKAWRGLPVLEMTAASDIETYGLAMARETHKLRACKHPLAEVDVPLDAPLKTEVGEMALD